MSDPILHHYSSSPYGEVIRTALGLKGVAWQSVEQPVMMPRPFLTPLTGGYRRIPVLQFGADIFCDTQAILRELDRRYPQAALVRPGEESVAWMARGYSERVWFQITVGIVFAAIGDHVPEAFKADRKALFGRDLDVDAMKAASPMLQDQWRAIAQWADAALSHGGPFLSGPRAGMTDLTVWLNVWFLRNSSFPNFTALTEDLPALRAWADRMSGIGHGSSSPLTPDVALSIAATAQPEPARANLAVEAQGLCPGRTVSVCADDYGRDPITGVIHAIDPQSISLWRETLEAGAVVTHFPRAGFTVRPV
jgi:glutathione S-transferase